MIKLHRKFPTLRERNVYPHPRVIQHSKWIGQENSIIKTPKSQRKGTLKVTKQKGQHKYIRRSIKLLPYFSIKYFKLGL